MAQLLLVEDDRNIAELIQIYLSEEGFSIRHASTGQEMEMLFAEAVPELVILDMRLPDTDGLTLCRHIRAAYRMPILMLSAVNDTKAKIDAITTGADDYLCKPFSMRELAVRVMALLRRVQPPTHAAAEQAAAAAARSSLPEQPAEPAAITIDVDKRRLSLKGQWIETTYFEFELMKIFLAHPGHVFDREQLLTLIKGLEAEVSDRSVDVHIKNLRRKFEDDAKNPKRIVTVRGAGYKFEPE
ncbi:response regulator transcription factor [Paenibacillus cymbidii]|uniref:response regulator transcription factor n=1 Tax=Paenibacillus cymbidii TaxID=1639034 RepID=UPI00108028A8|nr:response regulator transcription factor [Paenibacillus cymbidii]